MLIIICYIRQPNWGRGAPPAIAQPQGSVSGDSGDIYNVNIYVFESGKSAHGDWEFRTHEDVNKTPFHVPIQEPYLSRYYKHGDQYANILMGRVQILASKFGALSGDETKWAIEVAKRLSE